MPETTFDQRIWSLEKDVVALLQDRDRDRKTLQNWTIAIVTAMVGAAVTLAGIAGAGLVAYGELRQQAATTAELLTELRAEVAELRREIRRNP